jgi:hypothetical protein
VGKCFRIFRNEKGYKTLISAAIIALILAAVIGGGMFNDFAATATGAFALVCGCIWIGIFNSIQSICRERAIIKREYRTGLYISSYVAAHMVYEAVICFAEAIIVTAVLFIFHGFPQGGVILMAPIEIFITFFLVIYSADVLALVVSSIAKTEMAAMTFMPFVLILQLVLSGIIFSLPGQAATVSNLTVSKWGVNAVCASSNVNHLLNESVIEFTESMGEKGINIRDSSYLFDPGSVDFETFELNQIDFAAFDLDSLSARDKNNLGYLMSRNDENMIRAMADYESTAGNLLKTWLMMCLFIAVYGVICVVALKFVDRDKR